VCGNKNTLYRLQNFDIFKKAVRVLCQMFSNLLNRKCTADTTSCVKYGCRHTRTPSTESSHCNESWSLSGCELAKTSRASWKDPDTAERSGSGTLASWRQMWQSAEERMWASWRFVATDNSCLSVMMVMMMMMMISNRLFKH